MNCLGLGLGVGKGHEVEGKQKIHVASLAAFYATLNAFKVLADAPS